VSANDQIEWSEPDRLSLGELPWGRADSTAMMLVAGLLKRQAVAIDPTGADAPTESVAGPGAEDEASAEGALRGSGAEGLCSYSLDLCPAVAEAVPEGDVDTPSVVLCPRERREGL